MKKNLLMVFMLMFVLLSCKSNAVSGDEISVVNDKPVATEKPLVENSVQNEALMPFGTIKGVTYSIQSSRELSKEEYDTNDASKKALLVSLIIHNASEEVMNVSTLLSFSFKDADTGNTLDIEYFENVTKAKLDSVVGPNKVLSGDMVVLAPEKTQTLHLTITPDFMQSDSLVLAFEASAQFDVLKTQSEYGSLGIQEVEGEGLSIRVKEVNNAFFNDKAVLHVQMQVTNTSDSGVSMYEIPFKLLDSHGRTARLHFSVANDVFADLAAGEERDVLLTFQLQGDHDEDYDLYYCPIGKMTDWSIIELINIQLAS